MYRRHFNAVDKYNKLTMGPKSVATAIKTRAWAFRFFLGLLSCCVSNAYLGRKMDAERESWEPMSLDEFKKGLAEELFADPIGQRA